MGVNQLVFITSTERKYRHVYAMIFIYIYIYNRLIIYHGIQFLIYCSSCGRYVTAIEPAATALQQAKCVVDWSCQQVNISAFDKFEELIQECFPSSDFSSHSFESNNMFESLSQHH